MYPTSRTHLSDSEDSWLSASRRKREQHMLSHLFAIMRLILLAWKLRNVWGFFQWEQNQTVNWSGSLLFFSFFLFFFLSAVN